MINHLCEEWQEFENEITMKSINDKLMICTLFVIMLFSENSLYSQVTIGSVIGSNNGALLELKEYSPTLNNTTSIYGLLMPRVVLTDKNNLYPMFETTPGSGVPNSFYTPVKKEAEDVNHIGLTVYNLSTANDFEKGIYVWDGKKWKQISND